MTPEAVSLPPSPRMTTRRAILAQGVADGLSIAEAGRRAGIAHRQSAHEMYNSVREQLPALMDGVGLDVRSILCRIREKIDATETKFISRPEGIAERTVEAHGVQLKALELAVSLRPELAKPEATHIGTVNVLFAGALPDWTDPVGAGVGVGASPEPIHKGNSDSLVHSSSTMDAPPPLSAVEGTGRGPGGIGHANSGHVDGDKCVNTLGSNASVPVTVASADGKFSGTGVPVETVPAVSVPATSVPAKSKLSSRVVKRRVARLPVYRGTE